MINVNKISAYNFKHYIDVDYSIETDCDDDDICGSICRCGRIVDAVIIDEEIDYDYIFSTLTNNKKSKFLISWAAKLSKISAEDFFINIKPGYYGEEIGSVTLYNENFFKIINEIISCENFSSAVRLLLFKENNISLKDIGKYTFDIEEVSLDKISKAEEHFNRIKPYPHIQAIPFGVCLEDSGFYRLIDGHHRLKHVLNSPLKTNTINIAVGRQY